MNTETAWILLTDRRGRKDNRTAQLAALLMLRSYEAKEARALVGKTMGAGEAAAHAVELVRLAGLLQNYAVAYCNGDLTEAQEKAQDRTEERFKALAEALGFRAETSGDPRGHVAKLFDPFDENKGDGWGGGWPVYR